MLSHLSTHHKEEHREVQLLMNPEKKGSNKTAMQGSQEKPIPAMFENMKPYEKDSKKAKAITKAITYHIAKDMIPIYTVEKAGFRKMVKMLDPRYVIPSRSYFSTVAIPELYTETRKTVEHELKEEISYFAATTDLWSSRTSEPYLSYTVHYITRDFELRSRSLTTAYFPEEHTGANLADGLREIMRNWGLAEEKQVVITTDNASNMVKTCQLNHWTRLQCFGHRLHLAIENALKHDKRIERATGLCRKLVAHFSHSWKSKEALKKVQNDLHLPEHALITECTTRWGSTQLMIARVLEQQKALSEVLSSDRKTRHLSPSWQDIEVLESVNSALGPLREFTDALSGEDYVSISSVKPVLHLLNTSTLADQNSDTELTKSIKHKVLLYLEDKYSDEDTQRLLDVASYLDPRYKATYAKNPEEVQANLIRLEVEKQSAAMGEQGAGCPEAESPTESPPSPKRKKATATLGSLLKGTQPQSTNKQGFQSFEAEINAYLMYPMLDVEECPLQWWRLHKDSFPALSCVARKYLCIPATSCPSERLFSTSGNVVTCTRTSLKPEKVDQLVFLAENL